MNEPKLPPALRKPSPTIAPVSPPKSVVTAKPAITPAASAPSPSPVPATPAPKSIAPVVKATGGTITKTGGLFKPSPPSRLIPQLDRLALVEGNFIPETGEPFSTEAPLTGNAAKDRQALVNLARAKYPTGGLKLQSMRIVTRERGTPPGYVAGTTLKQLFGEAGTDTESGVEIGSAWFDGAKCQIFLRYLRSRDAITVALRPTQGGAIVFSNQISAARPASELGIIVREILGQGAREIILTLKQQ